MFVREGREVGVGVEMEVSQENRMLSFSLSSLVLPLSLSRSLSLFLRFVPNRPSPRQTTGPSAAGAARRAEEEREDGPAEKRRRRPSETIEGREQEELGRDPEDPLLRCCCDRRGGAAAGVAGSTARREAAAILGFLTSRSCVRGRGGRERKVKRKKASLTVSPRARRESWRPEKMHKSFLTVDFSPLLLFARSLVPGCRRTLARSRLRASPAAAGSEQQQQQQQQQHHQCSSGCRRRERERRGCVVAEPRLPPREEAPGPLVRAVWLLLSLAACRASQTGIPLRKQRDLASSSRVGLASLVGENGKGM